MFPVTGARHRGQRGLISRLLGLGLFLYCLWGLQPVASAAVQTKMRLGFANTNYFSGHETYFRDGVETQMPSVQGDFGWLWKTPRRVASIDVSGVYRQGEGHTYVRPRELYFTHKWADQGGATLGRKKQIWSRADEVWRQGLWQPRFMDDQIDPEEAGLSGLFIHHQPQRGWQWTAFLSPMSVPDMGPTFHINKQGLFESPNPWFRPPTDTVIFQGQSVPVRYGVDEPNLAEAALRWGGAFQASYKAGGFISRLSYAYKPMSEIMLGFTYKLKTYEDQDHAFVQVVPRFAYHRLLTAEVEYEGQSPWSSYLSMTHENPLMDDVSELRVYQTTVPAVVTSGYLGRDLAGSGPHATHVGIGFYNVNGGDAADGGDMNNKLSFFTQRYQYSKALRLHLRHGFHGWSFRPIQASATWIYDFDQEATRLSARLGMEFEKHWSVQMSADFLGLIHERPAYDEEGFIRLFRANDRVAAEVSYVF